VDELTRLREALSRRADVELAVLFGSAVTGNFGPASDLDVALRLKAPLDGWAWGGLAEELSRAAGRKVDLVDLSVVRSSVLRHEISKGRLLAGPAESFVEFKRAAFREWRDFWPRFQRLSSRQLGRLGKTK
jgi:predicted nucleotidyltransferase